MPSPIWRARWASLRKSGLTYEQAVKVYRLLEEVRGHRYEWLADLSWQELQLEYGKGEDDA